MKTCETCKWFADFGHAICLSDNAMKFASELNRNDPNDCGPSGRYWEPKESEE